MRLSRGILFVGCAFLGSCDAPPPQPSIDIGDEQVCRPDNIPSFHNEIAVDEGNMSIWGSCTPPGRVSVTFADFVGSLCRTCSECTSGGLCRADCSTCENVERCTEDDSWLNGTYDLEPLGSIYYGNFGVPLQYASADQRVFAVFDWCSGQAWVVADVVSSDLDQVRGDHYFYGTTDSLRQPDPMDGGATTCSTRCDAENCEVISIPSATLHLGSNATPVAAHTNATPTTLGVAPPAGWVPGDFNGDASIDDRDEEIQDSHAFTRAGASFADGDMDQDGDVDDYDKLDFDKARRNFQSQRMAEWRDGFGTPARPPGEFCENVPGDYDGDGDVDGNDFLLMQRGALPADCTMVDWRQNFGTTAPQPPPGAPCLNVPGDYDGDGDVDGNDLLLMQRGLNPVPRRCPVYQKTGAATAQCYVDGARTVPDGAGGWLQTAYCTCWQPTRTCTDSCNNCGPTRSPACHGYSWRFQYPHNRARAQCTDAETEACSTQCAQAEQCAPSCTEATP
jgi:hypothetical protein